MKYYSWQLAFRGNKKIENETPTFELVDPDMDAEIILNFFKK